MQLTRIDHLLALSFDADAALDEVILHGSRILLIIVVAYVAISILSRLITPLVRVAVREQMEGELEVEIGKRIDTLSSVIYRTIVGVIFMAALLMSLPELGLSIGPLIAGVSIVGIAVGFGAQNLVRDVLNGLFVLIENQYAKGDVVTIAGVNGLVEDINLRRTLLRDLDGTIHVIPHGEIKITSNLTKGFSRINLNVSVPYEADLDNVFQVINRVGQELRADPAYGPQVREAPRAQRVDHLGASTVEVKIVGITEPMRQWAVAGELRRRLVSAFREAGIISAVSGGTPPVAADAKDGSEQPAQPPGPSPTS